MTEIPAWPPPIWMKPRSWVNRRFAAAGSVGTTTRPPPTPPSVFAIAMPDSPIQPVRASKPPTRLSASSTCFRPSARLGSDASIALSRWSASPVSWPSMRTTVPGGTSDGSFDSADFAGPAAATCGWRVSETSAPFSARIALATHGAAMSDRNEGSDGMPAGMSAPARVRRGHEGLGVGEQEPEAVAGQGVRRLLELGVGVDAGLAAGVDRRLDGGHVADREHRADHRVTRLDRRSSPASRRAARRAS